MQITELELCWIYQPFTETHLVLHVRSPLIRRIEIEPTLFKLLIKDRQKSDIKLNASILRDSYFIKDALLIHIDA